MRRLIFMALAGVLCILLGSAARAQRLDGTLRVTVADKSQASIEEAKVTAENEATGVAVTTTASSSGTYVFPNLLVGTYTVTVEKDGFKKAVQKGIIVNSNQVTEAKVDLELGSVSANRRSGSRRGSSEDGVLCIGSDLQRTRRAGCSDQHHGRRCEGVLGVRAWNDYTTGRCARFRRVDWWNAAAI